jgi:hypothetical protein
MVGWRARRQNWIGWRCETVEKAAHDNLPLIGRRRSNSGDSLVQMALKRQQYRFYDGDKTYPKHIWRQEESDQFWFGFCINGISGTYKGWPIDEVEKREVFN